MAQTYAATGLTPQQWDDEFFMEYMRENQFAKYMGTTENSIIQVKDDLTKKKGDSITFALVNKLGQAGVTGNQTLKGSEERMNSRSFKLTVDVLRHGVVQDEWDEQKSAIDLRDASRMALKEWIMDKTRGDIITALGSINGVAYTAATEAEKDAWLVDNTDRVLFGAATTNSSSGDHSTSLANVDTTNDKFNYNALRLLKRMAKSANPKVRPIRVNNDEEWYVALCDQRTFRDIYADTTVQAFHQYAWERGRDNPLFTGGDLIVDGIILREIPEISGLGAVGNSSAQVSPVYLCGAQALGVGYAQRSTTKTDDDDYDFVHGVALQEIRGIKKMIFGSGNTDTADTKDHGVVTGYFAAAAD